MKSSPANRNALKNKQTKRRGKCQKRDVPQDVHDEGENGEHLEEEEDLGGDGEHIVLVEVVQQVLIMIVVKKENVLLKIMIMTMMATVMMIHYAR